MQICPVCRNNNTQEFARLDDKLYHGCADCNARWLDKSGHLGIDDEIAHYGLHESHLDSLSYREFLSRLADPVLKVLAANRKGLDFGCGPEPLMAKIFAEQGHTVDLYDPVFAPNRQVFDRSYDFIVCSETVEHFHDPATEFAAMNEILRPGGYLGIMTAFYPGDSGFSDWYYRRDPTHVVFYSIETFGVIASRHGWSGHSPAKNVMILQKKFS